MVKAVIFDIDNTLYNFDKAHETAFRALSEYADRELGLAPDAFARLHKETFRELEDYMGQVAAVHNRTIRYQIMLEKKGLPLHPHVLAMSEIYWGTLLDAAVPSDGVKEAITDLKARGIVVGVATNMTARMQLKKLDRLGLLSYVDFFVSSEETGVEKPQRALFERCGQKAGCEMGECLFVGDSLTMDVLGASAAGMKAVWYRPGGGSPEEGVVQITHFMQLPQVAPEL